MTIQQLTDYHQASPEIYKEFKRRAFLLMELGREHYSPSGILHSIRYETVLSGKDTFKCNNDLSAFYSPLFATETGNTTFFERRKSKLDEIYPQ